MVHFVLVHGLGHGGWCWYKVKPLLESAGHRVTAIDLAASGINMAKIDEIHTMSDYTQPLIELMDTLPPGEKVILVGHSLGGFNLAIAMDKFPHKISAAVFLTALMPDSTHSPAYVMSQTQGSAAEDWFDTRFSFDPELLNPKMTIHFGPKLLASRLYHLSSPQIETTGIPFAKLASSVGILRCMRRHPKDDCPGCRVLFQTIEYQGTFGLRFLISSQCDKEEKEPEAVQLHTHLSFKSY